MRAATPKPLFVLMTAALIAGCGTDNHVPGVGADYLDAACPPGMPGCAQGNEDGGPADVGVDPLTPRDGGPEQDVGPVPDAGDAGPPPVDARPAPDAAPPDCVDEDGDGYGEGADCLGPDCDDADRGAHPGAAERCNGIDDDCDGAPDACPCSPGLQNCPDGQQCNLDDHNELACVPVDDNDLIAEGEICQRGQCAGGLRCIRLGADDEEGRCARLCDPARNVGCSEGEECLSHVANLPDVGLCRPPPPPCDIYASDCAEGFACSPYMRPWGGYDFRCVQAGPNGTGESCGDGHGGCQAGHICVGFPDDRGARCQVICQEDAVCPDGEACHGSTLNFEVRFCV